MPGRKPTSKMVAAIRVKEIALEVEVRPTEHGIHRRVYFEKSPLNGIHRDLLHMVIQVEREERGETDSDEVTRHLKVRE
jgi:hypothetical protein